MASLTLLQDSDSSTTTFVLTTSPAPTATRTVSRLAPKESRARRRPPPTGVAPPAVARRNERERNRVRQVNQGFAALRQHVPDGAATKKLSKVETLRSAVRYIRQLQRLLDDTEGENRRPMPLEAMGLAGLDDSPAPSLGSDASSPYDSLSPEDEELLDFTAWLS